MAIVVINDETGIIFMYKDEKNANYAKYKNVIIQTFNSNGQCAELDLDGALEDFNVNGSCFFGWTEVLLLSKSESSLSESIILR